MDSTITKLSDEFDEFEIETSELMDTSVSTIANIAGLDEFELDDDSELEEPEESNEVQDMISELISNSYIVDDNMGYYTIKTLYDRLYFANNAVSNNEFLRKCNDLYDLFKRTLKQRASYIRDTHTKRPQTYNIYVDSRDSELSVIDHCVRSNVLNRMLAVDFEEIAGLNVDEIVEEEYQFLLENHRDLSIVSSDVSRLRRHITRTVKEAINHNMKELTAITDAEIAESTSIVKHVCPVSVNNIIKQVFTEENTYYFLGKKGEHVIIDKPVIHLLSCMGDTKPVVCWVPVLFYSGDESYCFASEDYMTFLKATQGLFKDRSTTKSDVVDLGISIAMFTQINDHILFNAPEDIKEEKPFTFERYSLYVEDAEVKEACLKLRALSKPDPVGFDLEDLSRFFCAQTNNDYDTMFFQAMMGVITCFDSNIYFKNELSLSDIMQYTCDIKYLQSISVINAASSKIVSELYVKYCNRACNSVDQSIIDELIELISSKLEERQIKRSAMLHYLQSNSMKFRYISISKYESCKLELLAQYLDDESYNIFETIANAVIISSIAVDFLEVYYFQAKSYLQKNITKSSRPDGLHNVMKNIASKLKTMLPNKNYETLDCIFDPSAAEIIKCMHYDRYAGVPILVRELLDSIDTNEYASEVETIEDGMQQIQNAQSFAELPAKLMIALTSLVLYIQAQAEDDYQEKITVNAFADYALMLDTASVKTWLGVEKRDTESRKMDLRTFFDFQQIKYARELSEESIGISRYIIDLIFSSKLENIDASTFYKVLEANFYKEGINYIMSASSRLASNNLTADSTLEERTAYAHDQNIQQAILDDGGEQAVEIWLSRYLRYLGD